MGYVFKPFKPARLHHRTDTRYRVQSSCDCMLLLPLKVFCINWRACEASKMNLTC